MLRLGTSELEDAHSYPLGVSWPCKLELEALMELDLEEYVPPFELRAGHAARACILMRLEVLQGPRRNSFSRKVQL